MKKILSFLVIILITVIFQSCKDSIVEPQLLYPSDNFFPNDFPMPVYHFNFFARQGNALKFFSLMDYKPTCVLPGALASSSPILFFLTQNRNHHIRKKIMSSITTLFT